MLTTSACLFVFLLSSLVEFSESAKVLGLFTTFSKSHYIIHKAAIDVLIERGHEVTVVTTWPPDHNAPKYRHIQLNVDLNSDELISSIVKASKGPLGIFQAVTLASEFAMKYNNLSLHEPQMQRLMVEESFDLVVLGYFYNTFQIGVAAHFKCPIVLNFMHHPVKLLNDLIGNPSEMIYVPHMYYSCRQPLYFLDRVKNVILAVVVDRFLYPFIEYRQKHYYNYNFPASKYPSYEDIVTNVSLVLSGSHFSDGVIRADVPAVINIGGIQIKPKPDPLADDIQKFVEGAKDGVVYFSLGSNARSTDMNPETMKIIYNVLSGLKQRVLWKWEDDKTPGDAPNILFKKWLPQDDILAHPNVKLFITHGGHGSVVESEYHGVPMVGMPLFADQFANMDAVEKAGYGLTLGKDDITVEKLESAVKEVLSNSKYRTKVQEFSRLYRDRPMSARDTAAFWLEYVIRHRGAKHMQSPAVHMNFIQYYGIDVFAFLFAIAYVVFKVCAFMIKKIVCLLFGGKCKKTKKEEKEKKH